LCLQDKLAESEFVDEVAYSDKLDNIESLSFVKDVLDVMRKVERRAY